MTRIAKRFVALAAAGLAIAATPMVAPTRPAFAGRECQFAVAPKGTSSVLESPANSGHAYADDRMMSTPTKWWTYQDVNAAQVSNLLAQNNARPTDVRVLGASCQLSVTMVENTGDYASSYWWYPSLTKSEVDAAIAANHARLISAVRHGILYTVVMVPDATNPGLWSWCDTDFAGVSACLGTTRRLTNIVNYAPNRFVVIAVDNSAGLYWCWWAGITRSQLSSLCPGQSVLDISANADGTFNMATVAQNGDGRVHDFATPTDLVTFAWDDPLDRPLFVTPFAAQDTTQWITSFRYNS